MFRQLSLDVEQPLLHVGSSQMWVNDVDSGCRTLADPSPVGASDLTHRRNLRLRQGNVRLFGTGNKVRAARQVFVHRALSGVGDIVREENAEPCAERPAAGAVGQSDARGEVISIVLDSGLRESELVELIPGRGRYCVYEMSGGAFVKGAAAGPYQDRQFTRCQHSIGPYTII